MTRSTKSGTSSRKRSRAHFRYHCESVHQPKENPFETKINHKKFNYVGKRPRGERGRPTQAKLSARASRQRVLKTEIDRVDRANNFIDRRLNFDEMNEEQKMFARLQAERSSQLRKAQPSYEVEEFVSDKYESDLGGDVGDDDDDIDQLMDQKNLKFKDAIREAIEKSKKAKADRIDENAEITDMIDGLDNEFKHISDRLVKLNRFEKRNQTVAKSMNYDVLMIGMRSGSRVAKKQRELLGNDLLVLEDEEQLRQALDFEKVRMFRNGQVTTIRSFPTADDIEEDLKQDVDHNISDAESKSKAFNNVRPLKIHLLYPNLELFLQFF
ncbi:hypothetical protein ACOME3_003065 [Neoechinorhynchus agilis]